MTCLKKLENKCTKHSVQRLWKRGKTQLAHNIPVMVASQWKGKAIPLDLEQLRNIPLKQRMTIEDVSSRLGISKSRIQRYLKKVCLGATLVASNLTSLMLIRRLG